MTMTTRDWRLHAQLIRHEGMVLHAYQDSLGYWTIGVGRLIDKRKGGRITEAEALSLLDNDIRAHTEHLYGNAAWIADLDRVRRDVLINMAFNLGVAGLLKFKNTLALVREGRFAEAAAAMLKSKWATQVGGRAVELAEQMRTGEYV